jgi:hypothetical protein
MISLINNLNITGRVQVALRGKELAFAIGKVHLTRFIWLLPSQCTMISISFMFPLPWKATAFGCQHPYTKVLPLSREVRRARLI